MTLIIVSILALVFGFFVGLYKGYQLATSDRKRYAAVNQPKRLVLTCGCANGHHLAGHDLKKGTCGYTVPGINLLGWSVPTKCPCRQYTGDVPDEITVRQYASKEIAA